VDKQNKNNGSGSDGSWFLEAVGAAPATPTPSETVASLERDNTLTELEPAMSGAANEVAFSSFDGSTGTSTSAFERPDPLPVELAANETGEIDVAAPPPEPEVVDDTTLSPVLRTGRRFRWPMLVIGLVAIATIAVAAFWVPAALEREADGVMQTYADASLALRTEIPSGQAALDTITDPLSTADELAASVPAISQLDSMAHALGVVAAEPLPRQLPVFPVEAVAELDAFRDAAQINAAQGSDVARRLGHAYVYRTTIPRLLTTGDLRTSADVQTINALSVSLASSLVDDANALVELPTTQATSDLNDAAHAAVERFAFWQDEYLTALAEGDEAAAASLIAELDGIRTDLDTMLVEALGVARIEIDQQIVELAASLEDYLEELTP
jgi:hypothetical protein